MWPSLCNPKPVPWTGLARRTQCATRAVVPAPQHTTSLLAWILGVIPVIAVTTMVTSVIETY